MVISQPEFSPEELHELLSGVMPEIPGYQVLRLIGRGGMSYVYLGVQKSLDRQVAIKVIAPEALKDEITKLRFEKEARIIARLQHPCIVGIYEVGRTQHGLLFYVLPYLARGHLGHRNFRDSESRIIEVLRSLLWALDYAHGRGVVHRDVKAENVLFDNADRPLLTDFGIAINRKDKSRVTGRGFAVGSGAHMAPEQARGEPVDGRADLYSLGVLTFEMLTGKLPFQNADPLGLALMHATDPVPRLPAERKHWQPLIDKAMAKQPGDRFADAQEMMVALEKVELTIAKQNRLLTRDLTPHIAPTWQRVKQSAWLTLARMNDLVAKLRIRTPGWINRYSLGGLAACLVLAALAALWPRTEQATETAAVATTSSPAVAQQPVAPSTVVDTMESDPAPAPTDVQAPEAEAVTTIEDMAPPLPPGEQALADAAVQISRRRLTQPPGDNAFDSILQAHQLLPEAPELPKLAQRWMEAATPYLVQAVKENKLDNAKALLDRASRLTGETLGEGAAPLNAIQEAAAAPLRAQLKQALSGRNVEALRAVKADVQSLGLPASLFQPEWAQTIVTTKLGDRVGGVGSPWVLVRLPKGAEPGLAMLDHPVSKADYTAFARATQRATANCRIRTAMMTLKKRTYLEPGFEQTGAHPVVCVSFADASAYAAWRSAADKQPYRLPSLDEWQTWVPADPAHARCANARCTDEGTQPTANGTASRLGVRSSHGNVREWLNSGAQHGLSWRDRNDARNRDDPADGTRGYDDIGFRLVRDVPRSELERR